MIVDRSIVQRFKLIKLIKYKPGVATMTDNSGDELESTLQLLETRINMWPVS